MHLLVLIWIAACGTSGPASQPASQPALHHAVSPAAASQPVASILDPITALTGNPEPEVVKTDSGAPLTTLFTGRMSQEDFRRLGPPPHWAYGDFSMPRPPTGQPWPFSARGLDFYPIEDFRRAAEEIGIEIRLRQVMVFQTLASGGYKTAGANSQVGLGDIDLVLRLWPGGAIHLEFENTWGSSLNSMGNIQGTYGTNSVFNSAFGVNRDAASTANYINDCYFTQRFGLGKLAGEDVSLSLAIGRPNTTDFVGVNAYTSNYREQFTNRSFSVNPTTPNIQGTLAVAACLTHPWMYLNTIVFDAQGDSGSSGFQSAFGPNPKYTWYIEWGLTPTLKSANGGLPGNYRFGCWLSDNTVQVLNYNTYNGALPVHDVSCNNGFYLSFDQMLLKENADPADRQGLGAWFKLGVSQPDQSPVNNFWGVGFNFRGLIPARDADEVGVGFTSGTTLVAAPVQWQGSGNLTANGNTPIPPAIYNQESVFEIYYNIKVFPWLIVTPDLQYLVHPGGVPGYGRDALVIGLKTYMSF